MASRWNSAGTGRCSRCRQYDPAPDAVPETKYSSGAELTYDRQVRMFGKRVKPSLRIAALQFSDSVVLAVWLLNILRDWVLDILSGR